LFLAKFLVSFTFVLFQLLCKEITRTGNTDKYAGPVVRQNCLFCTGNRKCNWYAGTITVNSELDSASNDIYFFGEKNSPNNFLQNLLKLYRTGIYKIWNLNGIGDGNDKNLTLHVFKYKHTKWLCWCITASLNYKNTMINRITMETVACLRSKCHLKQNLIPVGNLHRYISGYTRLASTWPSFQFTFCLHW
jgi:hypothetical protein